MITLSDTLLERYSRHIIMNEIDEEGQEKLQRAHVACVGLGGLGSAALQVLAGAGIGNITLIDGDMVSLSNLPRQFLYDENMVGSPKSLAAMERLDDMNSNVNYTHHNQMLNAGNAESLLQGVDIIIDACDNFETRYLINDYAMRHKLPFISASLLRFGGQISSFQPHKKTDAGVILPCYRCLYPKAPPSNLLPRCDQLGVFSPIASIFGNLQANEVLKYLLGVGTMLWGRLLMVELDDMVFHHVNYGHDEECCGTREP